MRPCRSLPRLPPALCLCERAPASARTVAACASGEGHSSHVLYGRRDGKRFSIYVPEEMVPQVREAIANGRLIQELVTEAGVRYTEALKAKRRKASVR